MVDAAIAILKKEGFAVKHKKPKTKKLDRELFYHVVRLLQEYYIKQKERGYAAHQIKSALLKFGHSEDAVLAALEAVEYGKRPTFEEPFVYSGVPRYLFPIGLLGFVALVIGISASAQEDPIRLALLFSPVLATMFVLKFSYNRTKNKQSLLGVSVILTIAMYAAMFFGQGMFSGVEAELISGLNFITSFLYSMLFVGAIPETVSSEKEEEHMVEHGLFGPELDDELHAVKTPKKKPAKKKASKKSAKDIEKEIEEKIRKGEHGLKPVTLSKKKLRVRTKVHEF